MDVVIIIVIVRHVMTGGCPNVAIDPASGPRGACFQCRKVEVKNWLP